MATWAGRKATAWRSPASCSASSAAFAPFWASIVGWICAILGIIFGGLGISKANKIGGKGKGMAIAGLVCGVLGLLIGIALVALFLTAASHGHRF